jgi:hypothetical protein
MSGEEIEEAWGANFYYQFLISKRPTNHLEIISFLIANCPLPFANLSFSL